MKHSIRITRYFLRLVGSVFFFTPFLFLILSLLSGLLGDPQQNFIVPLAIMLLAFVVASLNFYLSFFRPRFYKRNHGSLDGYHHVSGIPVIGTLLVIAGGICGFGSVIIAIVGLFVLSTDTGGLPWFLIATWEYWFMWDGGIITDSSSKRIESVNN